MHHLANSLIAHRGLVTKVYFPRMIVPLATGGSTDVIARIVAEGMRATLGQPVIVENVTGAGGTIGVGRAARSAPDGYTIILGQWGTNMANGAIYPLLENRRISFLLLSKPQQIGEKTQHVPTDRDSAESAKIRFFIIRAQKHGERFLERPLPEIVET